MRKVKKFTPDQIQGFLKEQKQTGMKAQEMADKYGFGLSTFVNWKSKFNSKAKRKVKATPIKKTSTKTEEQEWEALFNKFIFHRDEAEKARKALEAYVEQLR
jgi:transposase